MSGIRRTYAEAGERPISRRAPLLTDDITTIVASARAQSDSWAERAHERRDSALLLMGYAGAFRRSELVGLECRDVTSHQVDGVHVLLRRSKTDQNGIGAIRALPRTATPQNCPPCAFLRWLQVVAAFDGRGRPGVIRLLREQDGFDSHVCRGTPPRAAARAPLFRAIGTNATLSATALSGAAVHKMIRRRASAAGYGDAFVAQLGGHSLRAGFVTQAFRNGADAHSIMRQTGHRSPGMLEIYAREHAPLIGNAVTTIGL